MSDQEIVEILLKFKDMLSQGWIITDVFRGLGWVIILGLGWIVDSLENITDTLLGLKTFFQDDNVQELVAMLRPLTVILMAFSFLYTGYLLIFQKKFDREGIIVNVFLALAVLALLGSGMNQADRFTNDAIGVVKSEMDGNLADAVIKEGIVDVGLFDLQDWETPEIDPKNNIPLEAVRDIDINSYLTGGSLLTEDEELSRNGEDILSHKVETLGDGSYGLVELDDGSFITKATTEYYYRYSFNWFTVMVTLAVTAFTLLTIAIKLAKLFFELAFNYVLAAIIAPVDIHSGQKTKQVIQNILNIFLVTIMIFLSMKIYLIGTAFIGEQFTGLPYLIALFGFSIAVIDGPNMVERLFGIDAGLKSGWGALAGGYALAKGTAGTAKGTGSAVQGVANVTKSIGLKGIGGLAGVAGMAQGVRKGQSATQEQKAGQDSNGSASPDAKTIKAPFGFQGSSDSAAPAATTSAGTVVADEVGSNATETASALEQQQSERKEQTGGQNPTTPGLHEEMALKPPAGNGKANRTASETSTKNVNDTSPASSANSSNTSVAAVPTDNIPPPVENANSQLNSSESMPPVVETGQLVPPMETMEPARETRHAGTVITDRGRKSRSVQKLRQSYEIGENTGQTLRKNIQTYRQKYRKGE